MREPGPNEKWHWGFPARGACQLYTFLLVRQIGEQTDVLMHETLWDKREWNEDDDEDDLIDGFSVYRGFQSAREFWHHESECTK